jgi:cytidylate kinase
MKKEYDLSKGIRGKFYHPNTRLNLPVYLDADVAEFIRKFAKRKNIDPQTVVNKILRGNKEIIKAIQ